MNLEQAISISLVAVAIAFFVVRPILRFAAFEKQGWSTDGKSPREIKNMINCARTMAGFLKGSPERCRSILRMEKTLDELTTNR